VRIIYDKFVPLFAADGHRVLNNSESDQFLKVTKTSEAITDNKPDLHIVHPALYKKTREAVNGMHFGSPDRNNSEAIQFLLEAKIVRLARAQIGVLMRYLRYWYDALPRKCRVGGIVFNQYEFVFVSMQLGGVFEDKKIFRCSWNTPGSFNILQGLINELNQPDHISPICEALEVSIPARGTAYLGRGIEAVVIKVLNADHTEHALKLYHGGSKNIIRAQNGFDRTLQLQSKLKGAALDLFVHVVPGSLKVAEISRDIFSIGFLLREVGKAVVCHSQRERLAVLVALQALHALGICHHDPRIQNLLLVGNTLKWIDLGQWLETNESLIKNDVTILLKSLGREVDGTLNGSIDRYAANPTLDNVLLLL